MDEYLAIIKMFAGTFAPRGFMFCQGQLVNIASNTPLFALLGTTFGGDGQTTFALPDLRGRAPVGTGQGPGLSYISEGQQGGGNSVTMTSSQLPMHTHVGVVSIKPPVNGEASNADTPDGAYPATAGSQIYNSSPTPGLFGGTYQGKVTMGIAGGSQPLPISNPFLGMNYIICTEGYFPPRN